MTSIDQHDPAGARIIRAILGSLGAVGLLLTLLASQPSTSIASKSSNEAARFVVILKDSTQAPSRVAQRHARNRAADLSHVYHTAIKGYAATMPPDQAKLVERDPTVAAVYPDVRASVASQTTPTGLSRVFAPGNAELHIDESDGDRVDADIAILDTGIAFDHDDLNVVSLTDCAWGESSNQFCVDGQGKDWNEHGTHVAGTAAALDNGFGVVGVAPGARLWSVRVLDNNGQGWASWILAGIDWVTMHADQIEVANMSLSCGLGCKPILEKALNNSIATGVVYVVAAGNAGQNVLFHYPAGEPSVITVGALSDYDGVPGGLASKDPYEYCLENDASADDVLASFSNHGDGIDLVAPGVCIKSTVLHNRYSTYGSSGTSMASPHVAGAAAILASRLDPATASDVENIRDIIVAQGNYNWGYIPNQKKPLLDLSNEAQFDPALVSHGRMPPASRAFKDVSCVSISVCVGVGTYDGGSGHNRARVASWDGSSWSAETIPELPGQGSELTGVACTSASHCVAVGNNTDFESFSISWNGSDWSMDALPSSLKSSGSALEDVSCNSSSRCVAVGWRIDESARRALTLIKNESVWSQWTFSLPGSQSIFHGVSCQPSASNPCTAVGTFYDEGAWKTLVHQSFLGIGVVRPSANPDFGPVNTASVLHAVSCGGTLFGCIAVGQSDYVGGEPQGIVLKEGPSSTWTNVTIPEPTNAIRSELRGIACPTTAMCLAVGKVERAVGELPKGEEESLTLRFNGEAWSELDVDKERELSSSLSGVSCLSTTSCLAVGTALTPDGRGGTAHSFDGTEWHRTEPGYVRGTAASISCAPGGVCTLVGGIQVPGDLDADASWGLAGGQWTQAQRMLKVQESRMNDVSCTADDHCVAVGYGDASTPAPVIERFDGEQWTEQTSPNPGGTAMLKSVSCLTETSCIAVGDRWNSGKRIPLMQSWDGTGWTIQSAPSPAGATAVFVNEVSCSSASECVAVGRYANSGGDDSPLVEHWNGSDWSLKTAPSPSGAVDVKLLGVSCWDSDECAAVGTYRSGPGAPPSAYLTHWNGSSWQIEEGPSLPGASSVELSDVACPGQSSCYAVGRAQVGSDGHPIAMTWDGSDWSIKPLSAPAGAESATVSVSCISTDECMAAGYRHDGSDTQPLVWTVKE